MENKGENILRKVRRHPIELRTVSSCARTGDQNLTSSTRLINEVISIQQPQLKE
jgi:hypothetical protein